MTTEAIIAAAHRLVDRYGWQPTWLGNHRIGYSLDGALYAAVGLLDPDEQIRDPETLDEQRRWDELLDAAHHLARAAGIDCKRGSALSKLADWNLRVGEQHVLSLLAQATSTPAVAA